MSQTSSIVTTDETGSDGLTKLRIAFVNWPVDEDSVTSCDLLDGTDLGECGLVFFDPLQFARDHQLWTNVDSISDTGYVSRTETEFIQYLAGIKKASQGLQAVLASGGTLVIRSNIPKGYIKVHKKSTAAIKGYTETVMPVFFWLEEFLGKYSFQYCNTRTLKFLVPKNPLRNVFSESAVNCLQTLKAVGKGKREVIAGTGSTFRVPAISKITFDTVPGQIYLIPQFIIKGEPEQLIKAFRDVCQSRGTGSVRPRWLTYYENELRYFSPYREELERLDLEIEALKKKKGVILCKQAGIDRLADLLFENEGELVAAARTALETVGFDCAEPVGKEKQESFGASFRDDTIYRTLVRVASSNRGPIRVAELHKLLQSIDSNSLKVGLKGILIGNASRGSQPERREHWFDAECLELSKQHDVCLLPTYELFMIVCYVMTRRSADNIEDIKMSLRRDIFSCDTQFTVNRKKYAI
ncbi:MAG: hypothetical protein KAU35_09225 [candidate division Zixibacteria bacterium]|nr:hypothetical protein [candidate division Zixibacteria bacterium]